ncbi:intermembrane phospholipid transport protein YdbH family protein [Qipengyuania sp. ASV99]|uniref:intermembrane phospholipid transport protein YdbH family protein n=1 Tax=Qipengyuania sp. ASV99 TaxID=3399681 RepID=UPI003A4C713C
MTLAASSSESSTAPSAPGRRLWRQGRLAQIAAVILGVLAIALAIVWFSRDRIAADFIDQALTESGIAATYEIEEIGPQRQVLRNLVIGDPAAPDLTAERIIVDIAYSFGSAGIGEVQLVKPRLFGRYREGVFSLGALDPLIFSESDEPAALPALNLRIIDGRARFDSDFGVIGVKLDGAGRLDDGFAGKLAATAPGLDSDGCKVRTATLYGDLSSAAGALKFEGPVRLRGAACAGASAARMDAQITANLLKDFGAVTGEARLVVEDAAYADATLDRVAGQLSGAWRFAGDEGNAAGEISATHALIATGLRTPYLRLERLAAYGNLASTTGLSRTEWTTSLSGEAIELERDYFAGLTDARVGAAGTLMGPLLEKFERALDRAFRGGRLSGDMSLRVNDQSFNINIPEARLRGASGETVLALSRLGYTSRDARLSGNIMTGGEDMPRIAGRMEQIAGGDFALRLTMAEYRAGQNALAIPRLQVRQDIRGQYAFDGVIEAEGAIPGGAFRGAVVPVIGNWAQSTGLAIAPRCTDVRFSGLSYYNLTVSGRAITFCPVDGQPMISYRDQLRIAAQTVSLSLGGEIGGSPAQIDAARAVLRYPGTFEVEALDAAIGAQDNAVRLSARTLLGEIGEATGGTFEGGTAALDVVPLDLTDLSGAWSFADSVLNIGGGAFTLTERTGEGLAPEARFEPLLAEGATLSLRDNVIEAYAPLRARAGGQIITAATIRHGLSDGIGHADIEVPGIRFNKSFQPDNLSYLTFGVISLAEGTVQGEGRIDWNADDIRSSGRFRTDNFDFAAAFGPVRGVAGEIHFTDLINLTTAPSQVIDIASVNPGVEALGGRITYSMTNGEIINVDGGRWPFMGGELILRPTSIEYGTSGGQSYVFELIALDAATFVSQMELTNLAASGTFDGTIPIYFDAEGNGSIQGGLLISRPPGGNVAYVGELTYEDLGTMGNYAFQTLRSLDYRQMSVELNGDLAGEIVTNFQIDGVRQGSGTSQNFITREIAKLPIRFKINVRSDNFYLLATIVRGLFDPTVFGNPVDQGLLGVEGGRFVPRRPFAGPRPDTPVPPTEKTPEPVDADRRDELSVQPPESDDLP